MINKLCTLYLSLSPSPVTMVKSHQKKRQNYFRVTTSPLTSIVWRNVSKMPVLLLSLQQEKMMDFDYYEDYLRSISKNILLWQC